MAKTEKEAISRRGFVRQAGVIAGTTMLGAQLATAASPTGLAAQDLPPLAPGGVPRRVLGRTNVPITTFTLGNLNIERAMEPDGVFTWLVKQKKAGKCRFLGVSGHNLPGRFPRFLETGEVDVILVTLNFVDCHTYNFEDRVLPLARKHNVGVVAMKVFGGGAGMDYKRPGRAHLDAQYIPQSLRYALSLPGVASADLGVCTAEQIRHNVRMVKDFTPLSAGESANLLKLGKGLAAKWSQYLGPVHEK